MLSERECNLSNLINLQDTGASYDFLVDTDWSIWYILEHYVFFWWILQHHVDTGASGADTRASGEDTGASGGHCSILWILEHLVDIKSSIYSFPP